MGRACIALASLLTADCAAVQDSGAAVDEVEALRLRLPDDAAMYVLVRPADLQRTFDELGGRLGAVNEAWARPGGLLAEVLGGMSLGTIKGLARKEFFERSGLDPDALMALAFVRAPADDLLKARVLLHGPAGFDEGDCPQTRSTLVAAVKDSAAAVHYSQRRRLNAKVDGSWAWIDGRDPDAQAPAPARWRLPELPTAARPITARLSLDRIGPADRLGTIVRRCPNLASASRTGRPADRSSLAGCDAAWAAVPAQSQRVDVHLDRGAREISVVTRIELTDRGAATVRAGLQAPKTSQMPDGAALALRARFDSRRAQAAGGEGPVEVSAAQCPLFRSLGPLLRWPSGPETLTPAIRGGLFDGVTAAAFDLPADPSIPLSVQAALDYGRPARALRLGSGRLGIDLKPGEEKVIPLPILASDLRVRLEDGGRTSRMALGLGAPPPSPTRRSSADPADRIGADDVQIARVRVRPAGLEALAVALALFGAGDWLKGWSDSGVSELEAEVRLAPPRLVGALRVRWNPSSAAK